eukprot:928906-Ditylum_brightwellii.AAC.1
MLWDCVRLEAILSGHGGGCREAEWNTTSKLLAHNGTDSLIRLYFVIGGGGCYEPELALHPGPSDQKMAKRAHDN